MNAPTAPPVSGRVCTFVVADLLLGVAVEHVVEVVRGEQLTDVPLAPEGVVGLLNLRGRIVPAIDARVRLGLACRDQSATSAHVVLALAGEQVSLVVDREGEVVSVQATDRHDVPETVPTGIRTLLTSAYRRDGALLLVLDPSLVLTAVITKETTP